MHIHWMYRVTRGMDSSMRGTLLCWEEPGVPRWVRVRFVPDNDERLEQDFWMSAVKEPVLGEDMNYDGVVFRAYGKVPVSPDATPVITRAQLKMMIRAQ